jgi:hypothetical protein
VSKPDSRARVATIVTVVVLLLAFACALLVRHAGAAIPGLLVAWACGFWCAKAKGYSPWLGILGPVVALALPSLHPTLDAIRRHEARAERDGS